MPRAVKATNPKKPPKKKNGYAMPESIPLGEILSDLSKQQWKVGKTIGKGGFGEIYTACKANSCPKSIDDYEYVVKIEPHGNGPLFVEMHFYMRNAKEDDVKKYIKQNKLKNLGMPYLLGSGSHEINGLKHRFIILPRYGKDIWHYFLENGKKLPEHTIYRLALQMLDVYEYIHNSTYVHGDLKGANILLGLGKMGLQQAFLVDFGLASHYTTKDFKPDPKKMHNGTIEYTSRDAHLGVPTMRGDFEILGYNLIHWSGVTLPWEIKNLLSNPTQVQKAKEAFMQNIPKSLDELNKKTTDPIKQYFQYIASLKYNDKPEYEKCRKIFLNGLKVLNKPNSGELELKFTRSPIANLVRSNAKTFSVDSPVSLNDDSDDEENESDENEVVLPSPPRKKSSYSSPMKRKTPPSKSPANKKQKQAALSRSPKFPSSKPSSSKSPSNSPAISTPVLNIRKNIHTSSTKKPGSTIINDNITPNPKSNKTYEFNFELDVSMDANVIINVKRKKANKKQEESGTPKPKVNIRRVKTPTPTKASPLAKSPKSKRFK
ncbi:nucleosomal histone kinase 1 [Condylostylus longicornis]|uniref:nucleosomal histone kinase 1 n=1 Tax=Condylostylus longicornis TaxID=2530218 RepID=UPI00244E14A5|nr:nucleosomal histone kinase 1 [Condylostylus longicornis]